MRLNFFFFFFNFFQLLGPTKVLISIIFKTFKLLSKSRLKYQHCLIENINTIAVSNAFPNIIQSNYMYVNKIYKISFLQQKMWAIVTLSIRRLSSVRPLTFHILINSFELIWSHWANLNQALVEWSLDGPLPKLCPVIQTSNQDGHQAKNRKKGGWNVHCCFIISQNELKF